MTKTAGAAPCAAPHRPRMQASAREDIPDPGRHGRRSA
jgi:hypothetical protein